MKCLFNICLLIFVNPITDGLCDQPRQMGGAIIAQITISAKTFKIVLKQVYFSLITSKTTNLWHIETFPSLFHGKIIISQPYPYREFFNKILEKKNHIFFQILNFDLQKSLLNEKVAKTWKNNSFLVKFEIKIILGPFWPKNADFRSCAGDGPTSWVPFVKKNIFNESENELTYSQRVYEKSQQVSLHWRY